jgi:hypothetical protein
VLRSVYGTIFTVEGGKEMRTYAYVQIRYS